MPVYMHWDADETTTMKTLRILYIGADGGTSLQRARAFERLGHEVHTLSPYRFTTTSKIVGKWLLETGGLGLEEYVRLRTRLALPDGNFDLVWVDAGALVGPALVRDLRRRFGVVVNYNIDDPFGQRDRRLWRLYLKAVPEYDLVAVVREENIAEALAMGARRVLRVFMSGDEVAHAPRALNSDDWAQWGSEVVFVGTYMRGRGSFLAELVRRGVPLAIYGSLWERAREWPVLRFCWRGPGLTDASEYAKAIQCSKVSVGLLSKENRDLHTTRSMEIPYLVGLLCAERTAEHLSLYREGEEAVFWSSSEECAEQCFRMLRNPQLRDSIAARGRIRCLNNRMGNQDVLTAILEEALPMRDKARDATGETASARSTALV